MVRIVLLLSETAKPSPTKPAPCCVPPAVPECPCCSSSSPALGVVSVPGLGHSDRCVVWPCCHLLFPSDLRCQASSRACRLYIVFSEDSAKIFPFGGFLSVDFKSSFYVIDKRALSDVSFANTFASLWPIFCVLITPLSTSNDCPFVLAVVL